MTPAERHALADSRGYAAAGRLRFTKHARERLLERGATVDDVKEAICTSTRCTWQPERRCWKLEGGTDLDDDAMTVVVVLEDGAVVVTLF